MDTLRTRCEIKGAAKDIGGGCAHMTNAMNYPEVLQAGLEHCDIKYTIPVPRPNNAFKPNALCSTTHMARRCCHALGSHTISEHTTSAPQSLMPISYDALLLN